MPTTAQTPAAPAFDVQRRYVRRRAMRDDGFVEFDFAIGDPDLSVELMLPRAAFTAFCSAQQVTWIDERQGMALDQARRRWSELDDHDDDQQETTP
ncbi:phenol hydroxylase subunit [Pseudorhodoferax sp.]|uniref:phenol hydroxylase subunit n=1 Tax=Pseudorhodoferax sp. TaxID=1993553 RepID=UPI002DD628C6|nr:phenol hydroxylase subunit [Pseudorhodoferax sp.]